MTLPESLNLGPYRIIQRIGHGGMAEVYKAHHGALDRLVAIKVLPDFFAIDEILRERFQQEAQSIARLTHPNILSIFDFGQEDGITYLVLALVEGGTLADRIGRPMDLRLVVQILGPIADALDYAHSLGVLHRDIKPSNILLKTDGTPILADFGLAKMSDSVRKITGTGTVAGTPEYMSPEQGAGDTVGPASDRYALAIVAYEMLTGRVPFKAPTPAAVLLSHMHSAMPPTRELTGELSAHVEDALRRGLAKSPAYRYPTAAALVAALKPAAWPGSTAPEPPTASVLPQGKVATPARLPLVLVVDDSSANRELIEACLATVECKIQTAEDGPTALGAIRATPPDLVLLDVQMPSNRSHRVLEARPWRRARTTLCPNRLSEPNWCRGFGQRCG